MHCVSRHVGVEHFSQLLSIKNDKKQTPPHTAVLSENMKLLKKTFKPHIQQTPCQHFESSGLMEQVSSGFGGTEKK